MSAHFDRQPCGCHVDEDSWLVYCPTHEAAPDLLEALRSLLNVETAATIGARAPALRRLAARDGVRVVTWRSGESSIALAVERAPARCVMIEGCAGPVTHMDYKGYAYCAAHGAKRKASGVRCRKLRRGELRRLEHGEPLAW